MRLKRLELFGFKSFADRTLLDFEHAFTGIVGPNGCGKSNVVDAIRWVLGERRPTSMRGAEMTDVIFKGSVSRAAVAVAEVSMVVENDDGSLEGYGPEVSITRRVFKSGEGEYLIDGERVRLKDVRELLFNTGLGSRGYSVLEQGRIDAVLSADPLERRNIFEEAAGVSRYRQRRKEAESRLKRVGQDLDRLDDVLRELQTRSRSLKIQAGKAERYVEARDQWRIDSVRLVRHQVFIDDGLLTDLRGKIGGLEGRGAELRGLRDELERDVGVRDHEQEAVAGEVDRLAAEASEVAGELRALGERRTQLTARVSSWRAAAEDEARRGAELGNKLEERKAELDALEAEARELGAAVREAEERASAQAEGLRAIEARVAEVRVECEEKNERVLHRLHERTAAQNRVTNLEQAVGPHGERALRAEERHTEALGNLEAAGAAEQEARRDLEAAERDLEAGERDAEERAARLEVLESQLAEYETKRKELDLERARTTSRIEGLLDREQEREGLEAGARNLLGMAERGELDARLGGLLADHLRTDTRHARALDAVLGDRAAALVLEDAEQAADLLASLRANEGGQVRLVSPSAFGSAEGRDLGELGYELQGQVEGPLRAAVRPSSGFEALADQLLRDVWVVKDVRAAMALVKARPHARAVTLLGDVVDAGSMHGGWREVTHGPVGRRSSAAELEARREGLERDLKSTEEQLEACSADRTACRGELERARAAVQARRDVLAEAKGAGDAARARLADLGETARLFAVEVERLFSERAQLERDLEAAREASVQADAGFEADNQELQTADDSRKALEAEREELARKESLARIEWARVREQEEGLQRRVTDLRRALAEGEAEMERALRLASEHEESAAAGVAEFETLGTQHDSVLTQRGELDERLTGARERERAGRQAVEEARRKMDAVTRELEELMSDVSRERLEEQRVELSRAEILRRAEEDLSLAEHELFEDFEPEAELVEEGALEPLAQKVSDLRRELDKLGPVNLEAVNELTEVSERLEFLESQRGDLADSRASLEAAIKKIDEESERLFLETFHKVRESFQVSFRRLFGGGRADISLDPEQSVLDAGIEIIARAPGREMLPIGLLSGGQRTMTALALLFAIFEAKSSPFCVLDEVDAALDDANIGRFLSLMQSFKGRTQFVVVTHNKGTMSACDELYGITMEVKGVSRHVSVELSEVDSFVPEAVGAVPVEGEEETREPDPEVDGDLELVPTAGPRSLGAEIPSAGEAPAESELQQSVTEE